MTLFSASYYDGMGTNQGAIATYTYGKKDWTKPVFYQYTANITAFVSTLGEKTLEQREREYVSPPSDPTSCPCFPYPGNFT